MFHFLLVDDEKFVLDGLKKLIPSITNQAADIYTAQNGMEALEIMHTHPVDIVFTDIKMPLMGGQELIQRIVEANEQCKIIVLSGYSDFEYAQHAMAHNIRFYLLKPVTPAELKKAIETVISELTQAQNHKDYVREIEKQLRENLPVLREKYFHELACGHDDPQLAKYLNIQHTDGRYQAAVIHPECFDRSNASLFTQQDQLIALTYIQNLLKQTVLKQLDGICFPLQGYICTMFALHPGQNNPMLEQVLSAFSEDLKQKTDLCISIGVSSTFSRLSDLSLHVSEAVTAIHFNFIHSDYALNFYDNIPLASKTPQYIYNESLKKQLYHSLCAGQEEYVDQLLSQFFDRLISSPNMSTDYMRVCCMDVLNTFILFAHEQGFTDKSAAPDTVSPIVSLQQAASPEEMLSVLRQVYSQIRHCSEGKQQDQTSSIIAQIRDYIEAHMDKDISLEAISEEIYLTPNYISALFKQKTGILFKDFVLDMKIQRAKQLLSKNHMKIYEVSDAVGYRSVTYFSKVFKKAVGVYPSEYQSKTHS